VSEEVSEWGKPCGHMWLLQRCDQMLSWRDVVNSCVMGHLLPVLVLFCEVSPPERPVDDLCKADLVYLRDAVCTSSLRHISFARCSVCTSTHTHTRTLARAGARTHTHTHAHTQVGRKVSDRAHFRWIFDELARGAYTCAPTLRGSGRGAVPAARILDSDRPAVLPAAVADAGGADFAASAAARLRVAQEADDAAMAAALQREWNVEEMVVPWRAAAAAGSVGGGWSRDGAVGVRAPAMPQLPPSAHGSADHSSIRRVPPPIDVLRSGTAGAPSAPRAVPVCSSCFSVLSPQRRASLVPRDGACAVCSVSLAGQGPLCIYCDAANLSARAESARKDVCSRCSSHLLVDTCGGGAHPGLTASGDARGAVGPPGRVSGSLLSHDHVPDGVGARRAEGARADSSVRLGAGVNAGGARASGRRHIPVVLPDPGEEIGGMERCNWCHSVLRSDYERARHAQNCHTNIFQG
jgi:hypothetical protein